MPKKKATEENIVASMEETAIEKNMGSQVVETVIEEEVTVEKRADGVIEVKKHEADQSHTEELSIAQKLLSLYNLQQICTKIDEIRKVRGDLPEEVRDYEDECEGKRTRIAKFQDDIANLKAKIAAENHKKEEANANIKRYEEQQNSVRNNREYDSLTKEINFQTLEIQVAEKNKTKLEAEIVDKERLIQEAEEMLKELEEILVQKREELKDIMADTEKEETELLAKADTLKAKVDDRLLTAFERIRQNAHNGLAIVKIERDACGGCYSKIPPQRQLDINLHKKIIVCEACGRIFIDDKLVNSQNEGKEE